MRIKSERDHRPLEHNTPIREIIGSLNSMAHSTRPDIIFAVSTLTRNMTNPVFQDWKNAKRFFRYIKWTIEYGYIIRSSSNQLLGYSNSNYGGDDETSRSTSGTLIQIGTSIIYWKDKFQKTIEQSTTEAELYAVATTAKEVLTTIETYKYFNLNISIQIPIKVDMQAVIHIVNSNRITRNIKYIRIRNHFVHHEVEYGRICLQSVVSQDNLSDIFTTPLPRPQFELLRSRILERIPLQGGNKEYL